MGCSYIIPKKSIKINEIEIESESNQNKNFESTKILNNYSTLVNQQSSTLSIIKITSNKNNNLKIKEKNKNNKEEKELNISGPIFDFLKRTVDNYYNTKNKRNECILKSKFCE